MEQARVIDLFSGIGGFSLGLERTGAFKTVAFCEIDPFCQRVLAKHWPGVPIHTDVRALQFEEGQADVITGGFPCQDVSLAGRRAGLAGANSGLYRELVRAICVVRPRHAIVENVAALLGDGMGTVLGDLAEGGVDAEWDCVPASAIGAPHERDRVFIIAHPDGIDGRARTGGQDRPQAGDVSGAGLATDADRTWRFQSAVCGEAIGIRPEHDFADAAHAARQQMGPPGQPRLDGGMGPTDPHAPGERCGQGWLWRPVDSFARVRDEARRNAADPYGARLAFREGLTRDAWEKLSPAQRDAFGNVGKSVWPDEPALSGVDDGVPNWMDRVRCTGNTIIPQIATLIGLGILDNDKPPPKRGLSLSSRSSGIR